MKNEWKQRVDEQFSQLSWNEHSSNRVWNAIDNSTRSVARKKLTACLAMMLVLAVSIGVAAGIRYSQRYDTQRLAEETLRNTYGITDEMLTYFSKEVKEENGATVFKYRGIDVLEELLGTYTIRVEKGSVRTADWNLKDVSYAWGMEKLQTISEICKQEHGYAQVTDEACQTLRKLGLQPASASVATEEEIEALIKKQDEEAERAKQLARLEWAEIDRLARAAIQDRYGLSDAQIAQMELVEESSWWKMEMDNPIVEPYYWLNQKEGEWTEGDGIYIVEMNAETGVIEGIVYDSAIAGNG